jgi:hypothetical protein
MSTISSRESIVECILMVEVIPENRYSINSWAHKHIDEGCSDNSSDNGNNGTCDKFRFEYNNTQMFQKFVSAVNSQNVYNKDGIVRAIPIIVYHILVNYRDLSDSNRPIDTTVNLFDAEMRYLYDNGFKVLTMAGLGYDENSQSWTGAGQALLRYATLRSFVDELARAKSKYF